MILRIWNTQKEVKGCLELGRTRITQYLGMRIFARMIKVFQNCSQGAQLSKWVNFMPLNYTSFLWGHIRKPSTNKGAFYKSMYIKFYNVYYFCLRNGKWYGKYLLARSLRKLTLYLECFPFKSVHIWRSEHITDNS